MKIYATVLPVKTDVTKERVTEAVFRWLTENPKYKFERPSDIEDGADYSITNGGTHLNCANLTKNGEKATAFRIEYQDGTNWITNIVFIENGDEKKIRIEIEKFIREYETRYPGQLTEFIRLIVAAGFFDAGQDFYITDKPIYTSDGSINTVAEIINGQRDTMLPVVYISKPSGHAGYDADPERLAEELCGIAYVVAEESVDYSLNLRDKTEGRNPHGGGIGIYFTKISLADKHRIRYGTSQSVFEDFIIKHVRRAAWAKVDNEWSWDSITAERMKNREVNEFTCNFDEENAALKTEIARLNERLEQAEQERYDYKLLSESLRESLSQNRLNDGLILPSGIPEFFDGEQNDLLIGILEAALLRMDAEHRDYELLNGILQRNKIKGEGQAVLDAVEQAVKAGGDRIGSREFALLERYGFRIVSDNKHYKLIYQDNPKYHFTLEKTASDTRAAQNTISDITKRLSVYKNR